MAGGRIKGITIEIGGDTTKLESALKNVNREIKDTESKLKDVNKLLKMDPGNSDLLAQKYKTLQQEISATKDKLITLKEASKQADQALKDGSISKDQYDALQREITETEQKLKSLEQEYKNFGSVQAQQVAAAGEKMKELGGKIEGVGKGLTTHVTLPLAAVGAAGVKNFAEVDKTMQLTNKTMGNTAEQAELLDRAMKEAAANSTFGMGDAANATLNFARAGLNAEQAAAALAPAMNLAAGEGGNLDTVSAGLVATINGFHGSFNEAGYYADVFAAACNNSALDVDSLSGAMSVAAPIFAAAGYTVNDAALYMGVMANNGIEADKAANSLKTGLARLVAPAKEGAEKMAELGISVTNADGTMKDSITIQRELHDAFGRLSESEQIAAASAIFGKNQMAPWLALINTAPEDVGKLDESLRSCAGTTDEMAQAMMSGFGGSIEKLKSSIDVLVTSIGQALAPTIQKVIDYIQQLVDKFNALSPAQQETIVKIGLIVAAAGPLLIILGKVISAVGTIMTFAPQIVTAVQSIMSIGSSLMGGLQSLWAALLANPITLIIAAIALLVAAFKHLWDTNEEFRAAITAIWENIASKIQEFCQGVVERLNALSFDFTSVVDVLKAAWDGFCQFLAPVFEAAFSVISTVLSSALDIITGLLDIFIGLFTGNWSQLWTGVTEIFSGVWSGITGLMDAALKLLVSLADTVLAWFGTNWEQCWTGVKTVFETVWSGITAFFTDTLPATFTAFVEFFRGVWENVMEFFSSVWTSITEIASTAWETIKNVVTVAVMAIAEFISAANEIISLPFQFIWENCKEIITTAWESIKETVTAALQAVMSGITAGWESISSATTTAWEAVKTVVMTAWTSIQETVSTILSAIGSAVSSAWSSIQSATAAAWQTVSTATSAAWEAVKSAVETVVNAISSAVSTAWTNVQTTTATVFAAVQQAASTAWNSILTSITSVISTLQSDISSGLESIRSTASSILEGIRSAFTTAFENIRSFVSGVVDWLKGIFNFEWSLPHIKMPHFSISGSFSLNPPSVPHFSVDWYRKAMNNGMILNSPTIFGASGNRLLGGGEAGPEAVVGVSSLMDMIQKAVSSTQTSDTGDITIPVYIGGNLIDELIVTAQQRQALRSGGRA
ncbi:MAG: phage tail tape measure protein [Oscillospiraceae bacterium]|nr:phage tail tape measure protein [Oscillospiraceae bacterium]